MKLTLYTNIQVVEELVAKYRTIGPLLRKVEEVLLGTSSGKAPALAPYYLYWERAVFGALNAMVINAMRALVAMTAPRKGAPGGKDEGAGGGAGAGEEAKEAARPPLFQVSI